MGSSLGFCIVFVGFSGQFGTVMTAENQQFSEKCMGELGCFYTGPPFYDPNVRRISSEPEDREVINTSFFLYTLKNPNSPIRFSNMRRNDSVLFQSGFKPSKKTIFFIKGFAHYFFPLDKPVRDAFFDQKEDVNFIVVEYFGSISKIFRYVVVVADIRVVGAELALFIEYLHDTTGLKYENVHIIGHSLGAHAGAYAAKRLNGQIRRLTGLSPAGPYFAKADPAVRLDRLDAQMVDCIHTDVADYVLDGFGMAEKYCDWDFYPNGGVYQPSCPSRVSASTLVKTFSLESFQSLVSVGCDHAFSAFFLASSIKHDKDCPIFGTECDSWNSYQKGLCSSNIGSPHTKKIKMGYYNEESFNFTDKAAGTHPPMSFYFRTTPKEPYCIKDN